jgi:tRNA threonylcarbamoyladenosine biosynthesis protein TsaB
VTTSNHILAIEISNPGAGSRSIGAGKSSGPSVAVGRFAGASVEVLGEEMLRSQTSDTGRLGGHDDDLLPAIDRLCVRAGVVPKSIGRVAVSVGPGGYTSVRIACAAGKMIALANHAVCVSVPTGLGVWQGVDPAVRAKPFAIALASKGETFYLQAADMDGLAGDGRLAGVEAIDAFADQRVGVLIADQHFGAACRARAEARGIQIVEPVFSAENVLLASARLAPIDPAHLLPVYPREPEAVALWKAKTAK